MLCVFWLALLGGCASVSPTAIRNMKIETITTDWQGTRITGYQVPTGQYLIEINTSEIMPVQIGDTVVLKFNGRINEFEIR